MTMDETLRMKERKSFDRCCQHGLGLGDGEGSGYLGEILVGALHHNVGDIMTTDGSESRLKELNQTRMRQTGGLRPTRKLLIQGRRITGHEFDSRLPRLAAGPLR